MNNEGRRERTEREEDPPWWAVGLGVAVGAVLVGGIYALAQIGQQESQEKSNDAEQSEEESDEAEQSEEESSSVDAITAAISGLSVSAKPRVHDLNSLLSDIYVRYVAIKKEDFKHHYNVLMKVFYPLHESMKAVDPYYNRYSSRVQFAGSHYDRLRIKKPDEFDIDIVIGLPVNFREDYLNPEESDIVIEPKQPGYVQLRAGSQYLDILKRDDYNINRQAYFWLDDRNYILRSKFLSWFKSVVDRALNTFQRYNGYPSVKIGGTVYIIRMSSSGPAYTLKISNSRGFALDVDLVPALRFPEDRWLGRNKAYRDIPPGCSADYWMVVPKPNGSNGHDEARSWRVAMHDQERKFLHNSYHLRQVTRLLKKLRDAQQMDHIKSYHVKTLFLWKINEFLQFFDFPWFWQLDLATIFKAMLREFYNALVDKKIRYFWNKKQNMIENVPEHILKGYANKLATLLTKLEDEKNYMWAAKYLLTDSEYNEYENLLAGNRNYSRAITSK